MNKQSYKLSIVIPVYNMQTTFKCCIESILSQTYQDFELVLVDDGSTDASGALCDAYARKDSRITTIHTKNMGTYQARKLGAGMTKGEILAFSDADDWFEKNAFETVMRTFCEYDPDMLAFSYNNANGIVERHLYDEELYDRERIISQVIPGMMYDVAFGKRRLNPSLCCKLLKKELFMKAVESVSDRITLGEDALVTYPTVCMANSIFICNKVLYHYSSNESSCTHTYPLERIEEIKAFRNNIINLFDGLGVLTKMKWQVENYVRSFLAVLIRNWYGMELSPVMFSFPYNLIYKGSKVLVYGAGNVGKSYINSLVFTNFAQIVGWADKNYNYIEKYNGIDIIAPEQIKKYKFDVLIIAVCDEKISKEIARDLEDMGIAKEKIIWIKPVRII